jgi:hypothetical protein
VAAKKSRKRKRPPRPAGTGGRGLVTGFREHPVVWAVGVVVTAVATVMGLWLGFRSADLAQDANEANQSSDLSVARIDMTSTVELRAETKSISGGPEDTELHTVNAAVAKLVLHNSGEQAALVEELRVTVSNAWMPKGCHGAGGGVTSAKYDFVLPGDMRERKLPLRLSKKIDFEVAGQSNDRLAVTIGEDYWGAAWPWVVSASAELVLTGGGTVRTDEFVVMNYTGVDEVVGLVEYDLAHGSRRDACVQDNIRTLDEAMRAPGAQSPSIRALLDRLAELGYTATAAPGETPAASGDAIGWVAQLGSYPESTTTPTQLRTAADRLQQRVGAEVRTARSSDYGSLTPGYWVVFHAGEFADGAEALEFCSAHGITGDQSCVGRYVSTSADDGDLVCRFSDPRAASCRRP